MDELVYAKVEGAENKKPLVIIHGFLGMSDNWKSLATKYASEGFQVHLLDMRNQGRSFHSNEFNYDVMMHDVVAYCNANSLEHVSFIGHSMGGKVVMKVATHFPELVSKLVVADMSPRAYAPHHQDVMQALNAVDFSTNPSRDEVQATMQSFIKEAGVVQFLMKNVYRVTSNQLGFRFNLEVFNSDDTVIGQPLEVTETFNGATLFLKGGLSNYINEADEQLIKNHFPNAIIDVVASAGHWLHADNPNEFFEKSMIFFK